MNPYNNTGLQVPEFGPEGYAVTTASGLKIHLVPGGSYSDLEFDEVDFSHITLKANFTGTKFTHCLFHMVDFSGSDFAGATIDDCIITTSAFMWSDWSKVTLTDTFLHDVRFAYSDLSGARIDAGMSKVSFTKAILDGATIVDSWMSENTFTNASCIGLKISGTSIEECSFEVCDLRFAEFRDSRADSWSFESSDLSGAILHSVGSTTGSWLFSGTDLTAAQLTMCHAQATRWIGVRLFGASMERCNWFNSYFAGCTVEHTTLVGVGFNECMFFKVMFDKISASSLRLRFAQIKDSIIVDSIIRDSAWEFCEMIDVDTENVDFVNPSYCEDTVWPAGFTPTVTPNPI